MSQESPQPAPQDAPAGVEGEADLASSPAAPQPEVNEEELEFKPVVKYTAIGVLSCLVLGLGYATFRCGYSQGYDEAVSSQQVAEKLNETAVRNLTYFMQSSAADDAELAALAADADNRLSWIVDRGIRREAQWLLVQTLLERGLSEQAESLLCRLYPEPPADAIGARRAEQAAVAFLNNRENETAAAWYRRAADAYGALGMPGEQAEALQQLFAVRSLSSATAPEKEARELLDEIAPLGEHAATLRLMVQVYLGELARNRGAAGEAQKYFAAARESAVAAPATAVGATYRAIAQLESGDLAAGLPTLSTAMAKLGMSPADRLCRLQALRCRAAAVMEADNDITTALGLLHRAEGAADGLLPAEHPFWACLAEQRGWLLLLGQDAENALEAFRLALENPCEPAVAMQAMEGAGRCLLALNRPKEAAEQFAPCDALRRKAAPDDRAAAGRVRLLWAQALDHQGQTEKASELYAQAAQLLQQAGESERANLLTALLGRGYALVQAQQWAEATAVWQQVLPLVQEKPDRREEARNMLAECRRHSRALPLPEPAPEDARAAAEAAAEGAAAAPEDGEADDEEAAAAETP